MILFYRSARVIAILISQIQDVVTMGASLLNQTWQAQNYSTLADKRLHNISAWLTPIFRSCQLDDFSLVVFVTQYV